jgi:hypothetical protein
MTFEQTMQTIYGIFCKNIGNAETIELCREIEKPIEALQAEYDRVLEENNQLKESILRKDKKINQLDTFFKLNQNRALCK